MTQNTINMKIGDLSKISGISRSSIHYYIRIELLPPPEKKIGKIAYYGEKHLELLKQIKTMRDEGLSLYIIKQIFSNKLNKDLSLSVQKQKAPKAQIRDKELKKQMIIEAAAKVFSEKGYFQTNISDITDALGIGKSSFYLSFKNKEEVFFACIDRIFQDLWKKDFKKINKETDFSNKFRLRGYAFLKAYPRIKDILLLARAASVGNEDNVSQKFDDITAKIASPVLKDLKIVNDLGIYEKFDPELTAFAMVGAAEAVAYRLTMDDKYTVEDGIKTLGNINYFSTPKKAE
ncbi:MAG: MerR family transcriptional regulator [Proteobacteria bacterium]|nr:MerR family transcriptional regulator [Pseudomonadota bacterium]